MALGGMEQMMVAMLGKMGIDPEMVKSVALGVQETTARITAALTKQDETLMRIEAEIHVMNQAVDLILEKLQPTAGGFIIGDGSEEDLRVRGLLHDVEGTEPPIETKE